MRTLLLGICVAVSSTLCAQRHCSTSDYLNDQKLLDPSLATRQSQIENFIQQQSFQYKTGEENGKIIYIPVVVHILYNSASQNISDAQIKSQVEALNRDFRRLNGDSTNTPLRFKSFAADMQIEFVLATADPQGRPTNGIVRKQTAVTEWNTDDKIKFSSQGGDDAWDSRSYLNFWVGNTRNLLGYASVLGCAPEKDGIVINTTAFGTINTSAPFHLGRTAVHEVGHWLGLKHIWGDTYCGDDNVDDTPKQGNFTPGCPNTIRTSCSNGTAGDMYMNYMDYTNDACMNLFTSGQKQRMLSLFNNGGPRQSLLSSKGLNTPWEEALPEAAPVLTKFKFYPNPSIGELILNFEYDAAWMNKTISIINVNGVVISKIQITANHMKVNIAKLKPGVYFLQAVNGQKRITEKFIKL